MSQKILLLLTLALFPFAGWVMAQSSSRGEAARSRGTSLALRQALLRYQQGQPRHWRALMLQR
jgi:hypothetical protein